jgi:hypothetical protein
MGWHICLLKSSGVSFLEFVPFCGEDAAVSVFQARASVQKNERLFKKMNIPKPTSTI